MFANTNAGFRETFDVATKSFENVSGSYVFKMSHDSLGGNGFVVESIGGGHVIAATGNLGPPGVLIYVDVLDDNLFPSNTTLHAGTYGPGLYAGSTLTLTAIPEPGAWTMLITGLAFVGGALRRTRGRREVAS